MVKCSQDQVKRLKKALQREKDPVVRQRLQVILLREDGKTQPEIAELTGVSLSTVNRAHMGYDNFQLPTIFHPLSTANSILIRRDKPLQITVSPGGPPLALAR
jgi:Homeodomain-like domain